MKVKDMVRAQKEYADLQKTYVWTRKLWNKNLDSIGPKFNIPEENAANNNDIISTLFDDMRRLIEKAIDDLQKQLNEMEV